MSFLIEASLIAAMVSTAIPAVDALTGSVNLRNEISIPMSQIVDWTVGDIMGDGSTSLLLIVKRDDNQDQLYNCDDIYRDGKADQLQAEGEAEATSRGLVYGNDLLICQYPGYSLDTVDQDDVVRLKTIFVMDFTTIRPMSVKTGDIDGDGRSEISVCVFKTTTFHPVYAKRPFVYRYVSDERQLEPVWLGSRLSRPFDDYLFADLDGNGVDELVSTETDRDGRKVITCYYWWDFGFYKLGESPGYENILSIKACPTRTDESGRVPSGTPDGIEAAVKTDGIVRTIRFGYVENKSADTSEDYGRLEILSSY